MSMICVLCNEPRIREHELCEKHLKTYYWIKNNLQLESEHEELLTEIYRAVCDGSQMRHPDNFETLLLDYLEDQNLIKIKRDNGWYVTLTSDGKLVARFVILEDSK